MPRIPLRAVKIELQALKVEPDERVRSKDTRQALRHDGPVRIVVADRECITGRGVQKSPTILALRGR
jgi:hypothetical protein